MSAAHKKHVAFFIGLLNMKQKQPLEVFCKKSCS